MRFLFFRVLVPLLLILVIREILRSLFGGGSRVVANPMRPAPPKVSTGGELKKDPVCGTYVSADISPKKTVGGQTFYFCSAACRDKYRAA